MHFDPSLDTTDPLKEYRSRFIIPQAAGKEQIYFLGNSLGLQPTTAKKEIKNILDQWGMYGVEGFFGGANPWMHYHDQLTVNLHLMMVSFYRPQGRRNKILCEAKAFPSDQYMFETHIRHYGLNPADVVIEVSPREGEYALHTEDILAAIDKHRDELALILFSGLNYYSGQVFDMKNITAAGHKISAKVGFDLAHAAGNIPLQLHEWQVDFACWCSYKYLNSGPGSVGGVYIHERFHRDEMILRYAGWWGYDKASRFKMEKGFRPVQTAEGWQLSTPSLLLYASHKAALDIVEAAGWEKILAKGKKLNDYLWSLLNEVQASCTKQTIKLITPRTEAERGCQVSLLMLQKGQELFDELTRLGFIIDWREPNLIRLAPVPLYNTFEEVWQFANTLRQILKAKE